METLNLELYIQQLSPAQHRMFNEIKAVIESVEPSVKLILFVKQPYFYCPQYESIKPHFRPSVMLSFFDDHVNIFATSIRQYEQDLKDYKLTKKYNLQIDLDQKLPVEVLSTIFKESLHP